MRMNNMMKEYLGNDYSDNHLKNFCLYWMKGRETKPKLEDTEEWKIRFDEWRRKNDLDCLYFDGDMRADTLMSAWTPVKWVADRLNSEYGMKFYKEAKGDPDFYLKLLAYDREAYLPSKHDLVKLLDRFLELAELSCNYILLPDRDMNKARFSCSVNGETVSLFDEVPAMLYHIYQKESLGRFFLGDNGETDREKVEAWICREHLYMGFRNEDMHFARENSKSPEIIPLILGLDPAEGKWLTEENEIKEALLYMIRFLEQRQRVLELIKEEKQMNDIMCRPKGITCDGLWELYKLLKGLEKGYLWYAGPRMAEEKLMFLEKVKIGDCGIVYYHDSSDIDMPFSKIEWIFLELWDIGQGGIKHCEIHVDMLFETEVSPDELLKRYKLRLAGEDDLKGVTFKRENYL